MHQRTPVTTSGAEPFSPLAEDIWGIEEIARYVGISTGAARRLVAHSNFPRPLANQSRNRRWIKSEVGNFLLARSKGELKDSVILPINPQYVPKVIRVRTLKAVK